MWVRYVGGDFSITQYGWFQVKLNNIEQIWRFEEFEEFCKEHNSMHVTKIERSVEISTLVTSFWGTASRNSHAYNGAWHTEKKEYASMVMKKEKADYIVRRMLIVLV